MNEPLPGVNEPLPGAKGPLPGAKGPLPGAKGPLPGAKGPLPGAKGPLPGAKGPLPGRARVVLCAIMALAFVIRVTHVLLLQASPGFAIPTMDALYHLQWATAIAEGRPFLEGPFFRAPLYPWLLGLELKLFGDGLLAPRLVQAALGALTTGATFLVARRAFDVATGLVAAFLVATNWVLVYFDGEFLIPTLITPLDLLALWLTFKAVEPDAASPTGSRRARRMFAAGLVWGLSCIARPNPLLFLPFLLVWMALRQTAGTTRWKAVGSFLGGLLLPILPLTAYNASQGDLVLISSQAGVNFWIGNNPVSDGSTAIVPGTRGGWWEGFHDAVAQAEAAEGRELRPSEVSQHYFERGFAWLRSSPTAALRHLRWKARLFFLDWELGNNQDVRFFANRFGVARFLPPGFGVFGGYGLLLGLAILGLFVSLRGGAARFPLWGFLAVYSASVIAFFVCSRFRAPLLPLFAIYASHALVWLWNQLAQRRYVALTGLAPVALIAFGSMQIPTAVETSDANGLLQLSIYAQARGDTAAAVEHAAEAVAADTDNRIALRQLGVLLTQTNRAAEAIVPLRQALSLAPNDVDNVLALTGALRATGAFDEAQELADRAVQMAPHLPGAHAERGRVLFDRQRFYEAAKSFEAAVERSPDSFDLWFSLALSLENAGRLDEALPAWERTVSLAAGGAPTYVEAARSALLRARSR